MVTFILQKMKQFMFSTSTRNNILMEDLTTVYHSIFLVSLWIQFKASSRLEERYGIPQHVDGCFGMYKRHRAASNLYFWAHRSVFESV